MEQERYERGGYIDLKDAECNFNPEIYSRKEGEEKRTLEQYIAD
jgi:hypothetical protein